MLLRRLRSLRTITSQEELAIREAKLAARRAEEAALEADPTAPPPPKPKAAMSITEVAWGVLKVPARQGVDGTLNSTPCVLSHLHQPIVHVLQLTRVRPPRLC